MKIHKFIILTVSLLVLLSAFYHVSHAEQQLLLNYPEMGGVSITKETTLPSLIKYIYMFALGIVGVVALLSMLIGAAKYVLSAGNASKAADAKDQIYSAILGIILLLASVMILRTINPDLVNIGFTLPTITGTGTTNNYCQCVLTQRFIVAAPDQSNPTTSCQQEVNNNCPTGAASCSLSNTYQNQYNNEWMCDWVATWSARFGPLACTDCRVSTHPCSSYFNNSLHIPCTSAGTTCSATCL